VVDDDCFLSYFIQGQICQNSWIDTLKNRVHCVFVDWFDPYVLEYWKWLKNKVWESNCWNAPLSVNLRYAASLGSFL
jgi:hypothetical protein